MNQDHRRVAKFLVLLQQGEEIVFCPRAADDLDQPFEGRGQQLDVLLDLDFFVGDRAHVFELALVVVLEAKHEIVERVRGRVCELLARRRDQVRLHRDQLGREVRFGVRGAEQPADSADAFGDARERHEHGVVREKPVAFEQRELDVQPRDELPDADGLEEPVAAGVFGRLPDIIGQKVIGKALAVNILRFFLDALKDELAKGRQDFGEEDKHGRVEPRYRRIGEELRALDRNAEAHDALALCPCFLHVCVLLLDVFDVLSLRHQFVAALSLGLFELLEPLDHEGLLAARLAAARVVEKVGMHSDALVGRVLFQNPLTLDAPRLKIDVKVVGLLGNHRFLIRPSRAGRCRLHLGAPRLLGVRVRGALFD